MAKKQKTKKAKKVLWIEDEKALINLYKNTIGTLEGVEFEFMEFGQEAIDRVKDIEEGMAEKPDLILLDLLLPDVNGDKVCEIIRSTPATKDIPVYVLTNYTGEEMENKMTEHLDAKKYLVKTEWGPLKLIPLIKKHLKLP